MIREGPWAVADWKEGGRVAKGFGRSALALGKVV